MSLVEVADMQPPEEIDEEKVQYWCQHGRHLAKSQQSKALKLVEMDCIRYIGGTGEYLQRHAFICLPLNTTDMVIHNGLPYPKIPFKYDYNRKNTAYEMIKNPVYNQGGAKLYDLWMCNCQGWESAKREKEAKGESLNDGVLCCHLVALFYCFKMKRFVRGKHGVTESEEKPDFPDGSFQIEGD